MMVGDQWVQSVEELVREAEILGENLPQCHSTSIRNEYKKHNGLKNGVF
jgi:hypothetical protein